MEWAVMGHVTVASLPKYPAGARGERKWNLGSKKAKKCLQSIEQPPPVKLLGKDNNVNI